MAMLERVEALTLLDLNRATLAWAEMEYNRKKHSEIGVSPLERMLQGPEVSRKSPDLTILQQRFTRMRRRTQRKSDGTLAIDGVRFEVPNRLRNMSNLFVEYQQWNKTVAHVFDERTDEPIARIFPLNKKRNADQRRRALVPVDDHLSSPDTENSEQLPPLMRKLMAEYAATGLPPAYLPKDEIVATHGDDQGEKS